MRDRARAVIIGGGITGCSVAYHLARAGWSDLVLLDKGALTSGSTCHAAGLVTQFNPSPTMMRFRRYSIELYRELGVFETVGSVRIASSPESLAELQRGVSRARAIGLEVELASPAETLRLLPQASPESLYGSVYMPGDGNLDPHSATYALAGAARDLGAEIRTGRARDGHRARTAARGACGADRVGPHRDRGRRQRRGHVGAAGGRDGRRAARLDPGRASAHRPRRRGRARAAARPALLPRPRLPRLRQVGGGRRALRRLRARSRRALAGRRPVGSQRAHRAGRRGALRAAHGGCREALPVPRRRRRGQARLPSRCDDARRQPAGRRASGRARLLRRRRALAQRLRRGGRNRQGRGRARDRRRERAGSPVVPPLALRGRASRSGLCVRERARGLPLLLPAALPARQRRAGPSEAHECAARAHAGRRRGLRHQERLGARRLLRARTAVAQGGGGAARLRLGRAALLRRAGGGVRGPARARGPDRHDARSARSRSRALGPLRCSSASATRTSTAARAASSTRSS